MMIFFSASLRGATSCGATLVVVVSLDEEVLPAPVTANINLVAVEAKSLTSGVRHRTCGGEVGYGVVDGRIRASGIGGEGIVVALTAGRSEGQKCPVGPEGWCGDVVGGNAAAHRPWRRRWRCGSQLAAEARRQCEDHRAALLCTEPLLGWC